MFLKLEIEKAILTWTTETAPKKVLEVIKDEDDLDWITYVPEIYKDCYIRWLDSNSYGYDIPEKIRFKNGYLYLGYHG